MTMLIKTLAAVAVATLLATGAFAQGTGEVRTAPVFFPIKSEPPPKLIVEPPLPEALARGAVLIPYRTENFRIVSVLGAGASTVSPRVGHLHVTVDDLPWRWAETGDTSTVVVVGLPAGEHKVRIELASPEHKVFAGKTLAFTVPDTASHPH
ncbi:DUF6130 family protein [Sinorhizobium sp. NFACC03]|uniref:DUF6130 family protein n=1 Tax=Sinorhizobium sp. NFACC03 TaxID=1566295 RepID=UPI000B870500|nr:DUF6130 family protein [Sinorhizobium sp. NFACC03]